MSHPRGNEDRNARAPSGTGDSQAIRTAADVRRVVSDQITLLTTNPDLDPARTARLIAALARVALQAIETATLEARVDAVEAALRLRHDTQTQKETAP